MKLVLPLGIFLVWFNIFNRCTSSLNPLNGQHLRVIWPSWSGNRKGLVGPLKGGVVLEFLAARFNFTHEMVRVEEELEPATGRGQINYIIDNQADLLIDNIVPTIRRNRIVDLTLPWLYDYYAFVIPITDESANINAVIKPFQWPIWLGLGVSIACVIAVLNLIQQYLNRWFKMKTNSIEHRVNKRAKAEIRNNYIYVFGMLLSQGGPCLSKWLSIRLVAGVWTLATFLFVQAYSSVLFTYVVAPVNHPLINSVYDVIDSNDINLIVRIGSIDLILVEKNSTNVLKKMKKKLDSYPNSRCVFSECLKQITPGSRNVYLGGSLFNKDAIRSEFKRLGKCNWQFAKEGFISIIVTFALQKNGPYTQTISQGLLELQQTGIIDHWDLWFRPMPPQCNGKPQSGNKARNSKSSLSFKNLTGAFIVIAAGLVLAFLAFLCEQIVYIFERHRRRKQEKVQQVK